MFVGTQKNRLNERVLLSIHSTCLKLVERKISTLLGLKFEMPASECILYCHGEVGKPCKLGHGVAVLIVCQMRPVVALSPNGLSRTH